MDSTAFLKAFGKSYEASFSGYCKDLPNQALPSGARGRAGLAPRVLVEQFPSPKPSRRGEECPAAGTLSRPLCLWFRQLRRLQSLLHNLRAARSSPEAVDYRLSIWSSICNASGFAPSFPAWWPSRLHRLQGSSLLWPAYLPSLATLECLFADFRVNYRAYESWHLQQQKRVTRELMKESLGKALKAVACKPQMSLEHLERRVTATVARVDPDSHEVHLDVDVPCTDNCAHRLDGVPAMVTCIWSVPGGK